MASLMVDVCGRAERFYLSVSGGSGDLKGAGGREKTKTENKGGPGAQALTKVRVEVQKGNLGESWGILGNL